MEQGHSKYFSKQFQDYDQYDQDIDFEEHISKNKQNLQVEKQQNLNVSHEKQLTKFAKRPTEKQDKNLNSHSINGCFAIQTHQSVPYVESRLTFENNRISQQQNFQYLVQSPKQTLSKFTNFVEFHSLKAQDIWEEKLQISIDQFIKRVDQKMGYTFANEEMIALMKIAAKNPILQAQDFVKFDMLLDWKDQAEIMKRKLKLNSRRRHQKNHQNIANSNDKEIKQKSVYESYLKTIQQRPLNSEDYDKKTMKRPVSGQNNDTFKRKVMKINNVYTQLKGDQENDKNKEFNVKVAEPKEFASKNRNNSMKHSEKKQIFQESRSTFKYSATGSGVFQRRKDINAINPTSASTNHLTLQMNTQLKGSSQGSRVSKTHQSSNSMDFDPLNSFKLSRMSALIREKQKEQGLQNDINTNMLEKKWDCIVKTGQINRWMEEKQDSRRFKINNNPQKIEIIEENFVKHEENIIPEVVFLKKYRFEAAQYQKRKISQSKKQNNAPPISKKNSKNNLKGTILMVLEDKDKLTKTNLHNRLQQRDQQLNFLLIQIMRTKSLFQQQHKILAQNLINVPSVNVAITASNFS